jgi:hypothetical protein
MTDAIGLWIAPSDVCMMCPNSRAVKNSDHGDRRHGDTATPPIARKTAEGQV